MGEKHAQNTPAARKDTPIVPNPSVAKFLEWLNNASLQEELRGSCCLTCGKLNAGVLLTIFARGNLADAITSGEKSPKVFAEGMDLCCTGHDKEVLDEMPEIPAKA